MERVFKKLHCTDDLKFKYSVFLMQGDTYEWWKTIPHRLVESPVLTWEDFLREFREKYVSDTYVDMKLQEFLSLKQEDMTVVEYEREFSCLSHYAGVYSPLAGIDASKLISRALELERIELKGAVKKGIEEKEKSGKTSGQSSSSNPGKRKSFGGPSSRGSGRGRFSGQRPPRSGQQTSKGFFPIHTCETSGKTHGGVCYKATGANYNCGGSGHFTRDCTSARRSGPPTTTEGSAQGSACRGQQIVSRGRGRGRGSTSGS
ncbi:uncharacterized protein LOC131180121 [Hevea brasiliensis]|uniref:uncharacterized protein LOC131180121 n=1 Tax=Hevea brasiliensis TaxID=3981 RepID=UPI0025DAA54E|nr:uncharacterized protein LOC131180121 [Hevea brasiliensis]